MGVSLNYTLRDIFGSALGCILFIPILLAPGYVAAWFSEVLNFRTLTAPWKLLVCLPLSVAISPIIIYWAGTVSGWAPVFVLYGTCFLIWLSLLAGLSGHDPLPRWLGEFRSVPRVGWMVPAVWLAVAIGSLVNVQLHDGLYLSVTDYDHVTRAAITDAISRGGVRPANPFYFPGSPVPLRYHYFWFLPCSMVTQIGNSLVSSQQAIISSAVWCGWSLIALVPLYLRFFQEKTGSALRRSSLVALALFAITGLDLIPTAIIAILFHRVLPEMEWWNEQVTSWFGSVLWVPHHVAALVTGLTGFLLAWDAGTTMLPRRRISGSVLAGAAFATAAGTSIYVILVFAIFLTVWTTVTLLRRWWQHTAVLVAAGVVSVALLIPYLRSIAGAAAGGSFAHFEVRQFYPLQAVEAKPLDGTGSILRLVALPLNYLLELGFFGVAAVVFLIGLRRGMRKQSPLRPHTIAAITMAAVSVAVCTFLRSGVIAGNDLGWRGFLPAQFIMLLWAAELLVQRGERAESEGKGFNSWWTRSPVWAPLIFLGFAGTVYEVTLLRTYFLWSDAGFAPPTFYAPDRHFGARALELRHAYETLDHILPEAAKLQSSPQGRYFDFYTGLYSNRQTVASDRSCGAVFGGDIAACPDVYADISAIFDGAPNHNWEDVQAVCRRLSIDALIVTDFDQAWGDRSWIWQATPAIAGDHVRVYLVGDPHR